MKALVMRAPGEYGVEDVKKPVPGFQEVLVRMHSVDQIRPFWRERA